MELIYEGFSIKGTPEEIYELASVKAGISLRPKIPLKQFSVKKYVKMRFPRKTGVVPVTAKGMNYNWSLVYGCPIVQRVRELWGENFKGGTFGMFRHLIEEARNRGYPLGVDERLVLQRTVQAAYSYVKNKG